MIDQDSFTAGLRRARGFTLVELLVSAAITVVIAGMVMGLVAATLNHWNRVEGALTGERQARMVFDQLERDLRGALFREDGNTWVVATIQPTTSASGVWIDGTKPVDGSLDPAAADLADARFGVAGVWLRFVTAATSPEEGRDEPNGPVAVSYQLTRRTPGGSGRGGAYLLYRAEVTSAGTLLSGYDLTASAYTVASEIEGAPGNLVRPSSRQALATNVIDFGVRLHRYAPDPSTGVVALRQVFPRDSVDLEYRACRVLPGGGPEQPFPAVVDVLLRILTTEGARQIAALEAGRVTGDWWAIARANSKVFVRRIALQVADRSS